MSVEDIKSWAKNSDLNISSRTIYRDLLDLENDLAVKGEKLVVITSEKNKKTWKIEFERSDDSLNEFDLTSYVLFKNFTPLSIAESRKKSLEKITGIFYNSQSKSKFENFPYLENQIDSSHFYEFLHGAEYQKIMHDILWSIQQQKEIVIKAIRFDNTSVPTGLEFPLIIYPLQLYYHRGCIHIAGLAKNDNRFIALAIEQIAIYSLTNIMFDASKKQKTFEVQKHSRFGITDNVDKKIYDIQIDFSSETGAFIANHYWHKSQLFKKNKDGTYSMYLHCGINRELVGWIVQWMDNARVIRPMRLKKFVLLKLKSTASVYQNNDPLQYTNIFRAKE